MNQAYRCYDTEGPLHQRQLNLQLTNDRLNIIGT